MDFGKAEDKVITEAWYIVTMDTYGRDNTVTMRKANAPVKVCPKCGSREVRQNYVEVYCLNCGWTDKFIG